MADYSVTVESNEITVNIDRGIVYSGTSPVVVTGQQISLESFDNLDFDIAATPASAIGRMSWNATAGTVKLGLIGGNVGANLAQTMYAYVRNDQGTALSVGQVVYLYGSTGNRASVRLAYNTLDAYSAKTFGVVAEPIGSNQSGLVICQGNLEGFDTSMFAEGDSIYLGSTPGSMTNVKPSAPNHLVYVGVVERSNANNGQLYVRVQNGYELEELHNVQITSVQDNQFLEYDSTTGLWKNVTYNSGKIGYASGGSVTQLTSKSTGVTLNALTGQIITSNSALPSGETATFTLTNSQIAANDVLVVNRKSGGSAASYQIWIDSVAAGSCTICIKNQNVASLSESLTLGFFILRSTT